LPYRAQRIELLLSEKREHSIESLRAIQADVVSLAARKLLPVLQGAQPRHPLGARAMKLLETFDGTMAADKPEPLIFAAWASHLTRQIFADDIGESLYESLNASRDFRAALERVLDDDSVAWCNNRATDVTETCAQQIDSALDAALTELTARHGSAIEQWRWGDAHEARSVHRPFSQVASLAPWFEVRTPSGGDTYTVNVGRYSTRGEEPYVNRTAASLRAIFDIHEPANSGFMHTTGQSGLVFSNHYKDFAQRWAEVGMVPVWPADPHLGLNLTLLPPR